MKWQFWIDRGARSPTSWRVVPTAAPRREDAVGKPRAVPRRRRGGHPQAVGHRAGPARAGRAGRVREDGHHGGHQRAAGARASARCWSPPRAFATGCASLIRTVRACSTATSCCRKCSMSPWSRPTSAWTPRASWCAGWTRKACARPCAPPMTAASARSPSCSCMPEGARARAARRPHRPRAGFHAGVGLARGQPADQVRVAWRHHRGGRLSVAHPQALCRPVAGELPGIRLMFMQSSGGLTDARRFRGRTPSCPARPAASSAWCAPANRPASPR